MASPSVRSSPLAGRERRRARASPKRMKAPRTRASPCNSRGLGGALWRSRQIRARKHGSPAAEGGARGSRARPPRSARAPRPGNYFFAPRAGPWRRRPSGGAAPAEGSGPAPPDVGAPDAGGERGRDAPARRAPPRQRRNRNSARRRPPLPSPSPRAPPPASSREAATRGRPRAAPPPAGPGRTAPLAGSRAAGWAEPAPPRDCGSRAWRAGSGRGARGGCCHRRATPRPAPRPAWSPRGGRRTTASPGGTWGRASPARAGQRRGRGRGPERPPAPDRGGERAPSGRRRGRPCRPSGPSPAPRHDRAPRRFCGRAARAPDSPRRRRRMTEAASRWTFCPLRSRADPRAAGQGGAAAVKCTLGKGGPLATAQ